MILSPPGFVDQQSQFYRRMAPPSYQPQTPFYGNLRPTPSPLPSSQTPESDRRNSHSHPQHPSKQQHHQHQHQPTNPLSPTLHFHQHPQPSPSLSSIFPIQSASDHLAHTTTQSQEPNHLSLPSAFSPSAFGLSPPAFLTDPSLAIAPTPPSNPQYATFPFDAAAAQSGNALTPGAQSQTSGSHTAGSETGNGGSLEKDPFLSLLEQLAENEHSQGGPSELDFFLTGAVDEGDKVGVDDGRNGEM